MVRGCDSFNMAPFLSRLFSNRKRHGKNQFADDFISDSNSWNPLSFDSEQQVRMLLFQESDCRIRKLLFDSKSVKKKPPLETQGKTSSRFSHLMKMSSDKSGDKSSVQGDFSKESDRNYVFLKPSSDVPILGEMMFGSVAMSYLGVSTKLHSIRSPPQLMISVVFPAPNPENSKFGSRHLDGSGSLHSSASELAISLSVEKTPPIMARSVCMDVPGSSSQQLDIPTSTVCSSLRSDISSNSQGFPVSVGSSASSLTHSTSYSNLQRRWLRNMTTSMEYGSLNRATRSLSSDEPGLPARKRIKLGLSVIISLNENDLEEAKRFREFFFDHISLIESHIYKLKEEVCKACLRRVNFVHSIYKAFSKVQRSLQDLYAAPRLPSPVWLTLTSIVTSYHQHCARFIAELVALLQEFDNRQTNFFVTTLLTAVLTHHLSWVPTVTPPAIPTRHNYRKKSAAEWVDSISRSHPYNPLWMQLGDLYGAVNHPCTLSKTVVVGKKANLILRFLYVLSYFIRCSNVYEKLQEMVHSAEKCDGAKAEEKERCGVNIPEESTAASPPENVCDSPLPSANASVNKSPAQMLVDQLSSKINIPFQKHPVAEGQKHNSCSERAADSNPSSLCTTTNTEQTCTPATHCSKTVHSGPEGGNTLRTSETKCSNSAEKSSLTVSKSGEEVVFLLGESPLSEHFSLNLKDSEVPKTSEMVYKKSHLSRDSPGVDSLGYGSLVETGELSKQEDAFLQKSLSALEAFQEGSQLNVDVEVNEIVAVGREEKNVSCNEEETCSTNENLTNSQEDDRLQNNSENLAHLNADSSLDDATSDKLEIEQNVLNQTISVSSNVSEPNSETIENSNIGENVNESVDNCHRQSVGCNKIKTPVNSISDVSTNEEQQENKLFELKRKDFHNLNINQVCNSKLYIQEYHSIRFASERRKNLIKGYIEKNLSNDNIFLHLNKPSQKSVSPVSDNNKPSVLPASDLPECQPDVPKDCQPNDCGQEEGYISMEEPSKQGAGPQRLSFSERLKAEDSNIPPGSLELPLLGLSEKVVEFDHKKGFGWSLLAGVSDHYMADFSLQGVLGTIKESEIKKDLICSVQFPVLGEPVAESVCVLADTDLWKVRLLSSDYVEDKTGATTITSSPLVSSLCDSVLQMCHLKMPPEFCLMHLEDRLQELYFHSLSLVDLQKEKKTVLSEEAVKVLKFDPGDLPLLMAVASTLSL